MQAAKGIPARKKERKAKEVREKKDMIRDGNLRREIGLHWKRLNFDDLPGEGI